MTARPLVDNRPYVAYVGAHRIGIPLLPPLTFTLTNSTSDHPLDASHSMLIHTPLSGSPFSDNSFCFFGLTTVAGGLPLLHGAAVSPCIFSSFIPFVMSNWMAGNLYQLFWHGRTLPSCILFLTVFLILVQLGIFDRRSKFCSQSSTAGSSRLRASV